MNIMYQYIILLRSILRVIEAKAPAWFWTFFWAYTCHANIVKFRDVMSTFDWREKLSMSDAQVADSSFHEIISKKYNKYFPIRKINKRYFNNKRWLTLSIKEPVNTKNKFYVNRYKGIYHNKKCEKYKAYRSKFNHLLRGAERKHYQDLSNEHRCNIKKIMANH